MVAAVMATTPPATTRAEVSLTGLRTPRSSPIRRYRGTPAVVAGRGPGPLELHGHDFLRLESLLMMKSIVFIVLWIHRSMEPPGVSGLVHRRRETSLDRSGASVVNARIMPSCEYEASSSPSSVNTWPRRTDMPLPAWALSWW